MQESEIRSVVLEVLGRIAPEMKEIELDPARNFRDQFDFDSLDFLNFAIALHEELQVDIPETAYPRLSSLNGCIAYLAPKLGAVIEA
jgi:acyl carrier protein